MKVKGIVLLFLLFWIGSAGATSYTINDLTTFDNYSASGGLVSWGGTYVNKLERTGDWVSWKHTYTFEPTLLSIKSATLTVNLRDDGGFCDSFEIGLGFTESGSWAIGEVNTGSYSYNLGLTELYDGNYQVTLMSLFGDFFIDSSKLFIAYESDSNDPGGVAPVPEPATMLLLGTGMIGLAGFSRKNRILHWFLELKGRVDGSTKTPQAIEASRS